MEKSNFLAKFGKINSNEEDRYTLQYSRKNTCITTIFVYRVLYLREQFHAKISININNSSEIGPTFIYTNNILTKVVRVPSEKYKTHFWIKASFKAGTGQVHNVPQQLLHS